MLLRSHKPMVFSLAGAMMLHLSLFGVPVSYRGAVVQDSSGISSLSIKIAKPVAQPKTLEPEKKEAPEEKKIKPKAEKIITTKETIKERKAAPVTPPKPSPPEQELHKTAELPTPENSQEPESLVPENAQTSEDRSDHSESPRQSQQIDPMKQWLAILQQRINKNRRYPRTAISRGVEGDVEIEARVNPDGHLADARILSGAKLFRSASLNALRKSFPFPPPEHIKEPINFRFTIHYRLQ